MNDIDVLTIDCEVQQILRSRHDPIDFFTYILFSEPVLEGYRVEHSLYQQRNLLMRYLRMCTQFLKPSTIPMLDRLQYLILRWIKSDVFKCSQCSEKSLVLDRGSYTCYNCGLMKYWNCPKSLSTTPIYKSKSINNWKTNLHIANLFKING